MELKTQVNQKMTLSAHMQQCLEILAMDNVELGEFLAEQSMENPVMELSDTAVWTQYTPAMVHVEREQRSLFSTVRVSSGAGCEEGGRVYHREP